MDNIPTPSPVVKQVPATAKPKVYWGALAWIVILAAAGGLGVWTRQASEQPITTANTTSTPATNTPTTANASPAVTQKTTPVIIFTREISLQSANNRGWPTVQIERKVGNADPEVLATVGKVGEYPIAYQLSPDRKSLLISLESKLQALNLDTKSLTDLYTPTKAVASMTYSPDGSKIFIWDQKYAVPDDKHYSAHVLTIANQNDQVISQGEDEGTFHGIAWRADDIIILDKGMGDGSIYYTYDLSTGKMSALNTNIFVAYVSPNGTIMAAAKDGPGDICNDYGGDAIGRYRLTDPVTKTDLGTIGQIDKATRVLSFSPDSKQLLYSTHTPWKNKADCSKTPVESYFLAEIPSGQASLVPDPATTYLNWDNGYIGVTNQFDYSDNKTWTISLNGKVVITASQGLSLVGQFYQ